MNASINWGLGYVEASLNYKLIHSQSKWIVRGKVRKRGTNDSDSNMCIWNLQQKIVNPQTPQKKILI
jgi:hypothetical protein